MMNSDRIAQALLDAADDDDVKAIVFRVSSPGGSVVASDQILHALRTAQSKGKKIVVSMGEVAASGGYYVSAYADEIVASGMTITGSIGVLGGKLIIGPAMEHYLSSNSETLVVGSPQVTMFSANEPFTPEGRAAFSGFIDRAYQQFMGLVADGRHLTRDQVHEIARGRVWTGQQALERHLVDRLGGFDVAVARARALAGIRDNQRTQLRFYPKADNPFEQLEQLFGVSSDSAQALARISALMSDPRFQDAARAMENREAGVRAEAPEVVVR
jgi:protease-4